jgi:hypothetical protein
VQAVGPPVPNDGGAAIGQPPITASHTSTSAHSSSPSPPPSGVTEVQVGCLEHCYGKTTLDTSGLTLAQIEQLLGELQVPSPPEATAAPGNEQNTTQQTAAQSENGDGHQSQVASQNNGTVQVVVAPAGAPADGGTGPAAVNQTAQGIVQLQVGCIFYCSGTQQTQQAQQSNATVQSVDSSGAGAANTVSTVIWQVQVGCVAWCHDAVETQTATGADSSVAAVVPPPVAVAPVAVAPVAGAPVAGAPVAAPMPAPVQGTSPLPPSNGAHTRDSGGAPVRVPGAGLALGVSGTERPVLGASHATAESVSVKRGKGAALVSVAATTIVQTEVIHRASHRARRITRHRGATRPAHAAPLTSTGAGPAAVARTSLAVPDLELAVALILAAAGFGVWRWRGVR